MRYYDPKTGEVKYFDPKTGDFYPVIRSLFDELKSRGENFETAEATLIICETHDNLERFLAWLRSHPDAGHDEVFAAVLERFNAGHAQECDIWVSEKHPRPSSL